MPYGSRTNPVPHDPMSRIVDINFPSRADLVIIRSGYNLPNPPANNGRNVVFQRGTPGKDETKDPVLQPDALLDGYWVGIFQDLTNVDPDPPGNVRTYDDPWRGGAPSNVEITGSPPFAFRTPSFSEWGSREDNYIGGRYLWATGWDTSDPLTQPSAFQCCLINTRKMLWDFRTFGDKTLPTNNPGYRDTYPSNMSVTCFYQATHPPAPIGSDLISEFAAYKYTEPNASGDFIEIEGGAVYANSVRLLKRAACRVQTTVLLPSVIWSYNFKKEINVTGGTKLTDEELALAGFDNQPGG